MAAAAAAPCASRRSSRDSFKVLEADIRHANTLARGTTTGRAARIFLFLLQRTDCSLAGDPRPPQDPHLQGLCGRRHTTAMSTPLQKSQHQVILRCDIPLIPSLMQLEHGISGTDDRRQRAVCSQRYMRRDG